MQAERIQRLARDERLARHAGFWWGLAEGLFFFIVPDVYITFATLFALRAGAVAWLFSIAGSVTAIPIIYLLTTILRLDYLAFLQTIPGISGPMVAQVGGILRADGLPYTPFLASGGVPLKLYAASAFSLGLSLGSVLIWTVFARIVRIAPVFLLAATFRLLFRRRIDAYPTAWCGALAVGWIVFYVFYFVRTSQV